MLKHLGVCGLVALVLGGMTTGCPAVGDGSIVDLVQRVKPAVVTITTYSASGKEISQGSGFFTRPDEITTNWHVVDKAGSIRVKTTDGKTHRVTGMVAGDKKADLAVLKLAEPGAMGAPLTIDSATPREGEKILVIGAAGGFEHTVSDGIISAIREIPGIGRVVQITAPVSHGSSGSPVVNMRGEVVGVVVGYKDEGQNLNFAVAGDRVLALKSGVGVSPAKPPAGIGSGPRRTGMESGMALIRQEDFAGAAAVFEEVVESSPDNHDAWHMIGVCYVELRQFKKALNGFYRAAKIKPDFADAYTGMGVALIGMGELDLAAKAFRVSIKLAPNEAFPHYGLGLLYVKSGDKAAAMKEYAVLKTLDPKMAGELYEMARK